MKPQVISTTTKTTVFKTVKLMLPKDIIVIEQYQDDVLVSQEWKTKLGFKVTHPTAYKPENMYFQYYEDVSCLDSEECINFSNFFNHVPKPSLVKDWSKFKGIHHVLMFSIGLDGNIYRINSSYPIPMWRNKDYVGGITNGDFDLEKAKKVLEKQSWTRNVKIENIPHYNAYNGRTQGINFDYKLPSGKDLVEKLNKIPMFKGKILFT